MAYNIHYRIAYSRYSGNITTIDILDSSYGGSIISLFASDDPLNISLTGDVNNIFASTIGTGATISVLSTPLALQNLFTSDPQKFVIKVYNGSSGTNLFWQGFVNTGIYNESYSNSISLPTSPITIQCNDGMAVLDSLYYRDVDGSTLYGGTPTIATVLRTILGKLDLSINSLYSNSNICYDWDGYGGHSTNIFNNNGVNNANYYDENQIPMTCREVLNSIFGSMGLVMSFKGSDIYLIDPINLHSTGFGHVYDLATFTENSSTFGGYLDISNKDINWFQNGSGLDIIDKKDEIDVKYDPFNLSAFKYDFNDSNNWLTTPNWQDKTGWYLDPSLAQRGWYYTYTHSKGIGLKKLVDDDPVYCLRLYNNAAGTTGNGVFVYQIPNSTIVQDVNMKLRVTMDVYVHTKDDTLNIFSTAASRASISQVQIPVSITVGGQYYKGDYSWDYTISGDYRQPLTVQNDPSTDLINDKWITASLTIPTLPLTSPAVNGEIQIGIWDNIKNLWTNQIFPTAGATVVSNILIKNLQVDFVDAWTGKVIDNTGTLKKGNIDTILIYKTNPLEIPITTGIGPYGCSRGALKLGLINAPYLTRNDGSIKQYASGELILQNMMSQYKQPRFVLNGTLDVKNTMLNTNMKLIKDSAFQVPSTRAFYIVNGTYNDRYENMNAQMLEITSTRDAVV